MADSLCVELVVVDGGACRLHQRAHIVAAGKDASHLQRAALRCSNTAGAHLVHQPRLLGLDGAESRVGEV